MTDLDRKHLAAAYMAAHHAATGERCEVVPWPHGWYGLAYAGDVRRLRASELIKRLAVLAGELERRAAQGFHQ